MIMNRRSFLTAGAGAAALVLTPEALLAATANRVAGDWSLAFADLEADLPRHAMRLIHGQAPAGLSGALYRNGSGKFRRPGGSATHWFDGDGLMRAFRIHDGQATLEARFADTPKRRQDTAAGAVITPGFGTPAGPGAKVGSNDDTNAANISVLPMGDQLWALWEAGSPLVMDPNTLATRDFKVLRPDLKSMPFLAHPRREPNGRVWNLGLAGTKAIVWRLSAIGDLEAADLIDLPRASYVHDFTASDRHLIIVLQPWVQDRMGGRTWGRRCWCWTRPTSPNAACSTCPVSSASTWATPGPKPTGPCGSTPASAPIPASPYRARATCWSARRPTAAAADDWP
jgi:all-trans-8'-apo-beta-carotenal 15,15'-oxygenase